MAIIYVLTNKISGKSYVGKTIQPFDVRWGGHVGSARRGDNRMLVCRAIKKYGAENFDRRIIEECSEDVLGSQEMFWIAELKTHVSQSGYNLTFGGDGGLPGYVFSEESKEKIRQKAIGRKHSEETRMKMSDVAKGRAKSLESVEARARSNRGKKRTEEQKTNIRNGQLASGYVHSEETRIKIGLASKGRVTTKETRLKIGDSSRGRKHSVSAKKAISAAHSKAILQMTLDGIFVKEYNSIKDAVSITKVSGSSIQRSLYTGKPKCGFIWKYKGGC